MEDAERVRKVCTAAERVTPRHNRPIAGRRGDIMNRGIIGTIIGILVIIILVIVIMQLT